MEELIESIGNNVKTISFDTETEMWTIIYKTDLNDDYVHNDNLIEHLQNA